MADQGSAGSAWVFGALVNHQGGGEPEALAAGFQPEARLVAQEAPPAPVSEGPPVVPQEQAVSQGPPVAPHQPRQATPTTIRAAAAAQLARAQRQGE